MKKIIIACLITIFLPAVVSAAVSFSALRERDDIVVDLETPGRPLVVEKTTIPLREGNNRVDFSWPGVELERDSIRLDIFDPEENFELISSSYPSGKNKLTWNIYSEKTAELEGLVSYNLRNISRQVAYSGLLDPKGEKLELREEVILFNNSGFDFNRAMLELGYGNRMRRDWRSGESKRLSVYRAADVSLQKVAVYDGRGISLEQQRKLDKLPVYYEFANDEKHRLGNRSLYEGKIRLYEGNKARETFIGEDNLPYTPVGDSIALSAGDNRDINLERSLKEKSKRNVRRNTDGEIELYDLGRTIMFTLKNSGDNSLRLRLIESLPDEWQMESSSHDFSKLSNEAIEFELSVEPKAEEVLLFEYLEKNIRGGQR